MRDLQALVSANRHAAKSARKPGYRRPSCPDIGARTYGAGYQNERRNAYVRCQAPGGALADCETCLDAVADAGRAK